MLSKENRGCPGERVIFYGEVGKGSLTRGCGSCLEAWARELSGHRHGLWSQTAWVPIPGPPLPDPAILNREPNFSMPLFLHPQNEDDNIVPSHRVVRIKWVLTCKVLRRDKHLWALAITVTAANTSGGKCLLGRGESKCKGPEAQGKGEFDLLGEEQRAGGGSSQLE